VTEVKDHPTTTSDNEGTAAAPSRNRGALWALRKAGTLIIDNRPVLLVILILALGGYMAYMYPVSFPTAENFGAVLLNAAQSGILVIGMMLLMIGGSFDLSIGSTLALSGVVAALIITQGGLPPWLAVIGGILAGVVCGLVNGVIVTKVRINALIATLATAGIIRGVTQLVSGTGVGYIDPEFAKLGQTTFFGLQSPFWIMIALAAVAAVLVARTRFFRQYYFVGSNERAARLSGMRPPRLILISFLIMGGLAGIAGVLSAARLNAAVVTAGTGVELQVITAAVLGGATLKGGEGTILGGVLGVLFIAIVNNALIIMRVDAFWQNIVVGVVLLLAVSLDRWKRSAAT